MPRIPFLYLFLFMAKSIWPSPLGETPCHQMSAVAQRAALTSLHNYYAIPDTVSLKVVRTWQNPETCYTQLTIIMPNGTANRVLVSPDFRFLSLGDVLDVRNDPMRGQLLEAPAIRTLLSTVATPSRGAAQAPITVTVFSDFECPYCQQFNDMWNQLPSAYKQQVKFVFMNTPLTIHPWAALAAKTALCAGFSNPDNFWRLHDYFFAHQSELSVTTLTGHISSALKDDAGTDIHQITSCADSSRVVASLNDQLALARTLAVNGTPTIFINGVRYEGFRDLEALKAALMTWHGTKPPLQSSLLIGPPHYGP